MGIFTNLFCPVIEKNESQTDTDTFLSLYLLESGQAEILARIWPSWDLNPELSGFQFIYFFLKHVVASFEGAWEWQMECLSRLQWLILKLYRYWYIFKPLFLKLCLLWATSISHSFLGNNHDWISHLIFHLIPVSSSTIVRLSHFPFLYLFFFFFNE